MTTIWEFPLEQQTTTLHLPQSARFLSVQVQHGIPCVWVLLNPEDDKIPHTIDIYGTGWEIACDDPETPGNYLGTYQLAGGSLVFHAFVRGGA